MLDRRLTASSAPSLAFTPQGGEIPRQPGRMPLHHSWKLPEPQPVSRNVVRLVNVNSATARTTVNHSHTTR